MVFSRMLPVGVLLGLALGLAACQTAGPATSVRGEAQSERAVGEYTLGAGDQLRVTVFGQADLSGQFEVDGAGSISMPLIGQVSATGKTTPELEQTLIAKLSEGYLREPQVSIEVTNYRPFYILGEVTSPREYPYTSGLSVVNAVATAGGFTYRANKRVVYIKAIDESEERAYQLTSKILVQPGDTIRIGERIF